MKKIINDLLVNFIDEINQLSESPLMTILVILLVLGILFLIGGYLWEKKFFSKVWNFIKIKKPNTIFFIAPGLLFVGVCLFFIFEKNSFKEKMISFILGAIFIILGIVLFLIIDIILGLSYLVFLIIIKIPGVKIIFDLIFFILFITSLWILEALFFFVFNPIKWLIPKIMILCCIIYFSFRDVDKLDNTFE